MAKSYWKYVHTPLINTICIVLIFGIGFLFWIAT